VLVMFNFLSYHTHATCLQANAASIQSMLASLGAGGDNREIKERSLPFGKFKEMLSGLMGGQAGGCGCGEQSASGYVVNRAQV